MTNLNSTQPVAGTAAPAAAGAKDAAGVLGKDDFLKLLMAQLQHQDPLAPQDDQAWIGQMAQFSTLEQISNNAQSTNEIVKQLGRSGALSLIGRTVTYDDGEKSVTGVVQRVEMNDGAATLTVDGKTGIDAGSVTEVR